MPLKPSFPLNGLRESEEDAIVVAGKDSDAPSIFYTSITDKLRQLGVEYSMRDINYLMGNDRTKYALLNSPTLTQVEARTFLTYAKSKIKSATREMIAEEHSFFLDGSLNVVQGQGKSSLYHAYSKSGVDGFVREVLTNQGLNHKNLVKFVKTFSIQDDARQVIIMTFYPRSVADWLIQDPELPLPAIKIIVQSCFDALCHLHSKGFCFADLKPSNIMLPNTEPSYATLVDYGAAVRLGSPIIECTQTYCLDASSIIATEELDWICLGTTLAQIAGFDIFSFTSAAALVYDVNRSTKEHNLKSLIISCLQSPSSTTIESALNLLEGQT